MKKTKLLMPILATTAVASCALPIVSCGDYTPEEKADPDVSVLNLSDTTYNVEIASEGKAKIGEQLDLKLTWEDTDTGAYYINVAVVVIGNKVIAEKSSIEPDGFEVHDYTSTGATVTIPGKLITDDTPIQVLIDLEQSAYDEAITVDTFADEYIKLTIGDDDFLYDVIHSQGEAGTDEKSKFFHPKKGETVKFAFDLKKFTSLRVNEPIYAIMGDWTPHLSDPWTFTAKSLRKSNCSYIWYGEETKPLEFEEDTSLHAFKIVPPANGWEDQKPIFFKYTFVDNHPNYFQVMLGQEHQA